MSLENFAGEVRTVRQQLLEVNTGIVIQQHTSDSWSIFVTKRGLDVAIDAVANKFVSLSSLKIIERRDINWLKVDHLHIWSWLLHLLRCSLNLLLWGLLSHTWLLLLLHLRVLVSLVVVLSSILIIVLTLVVVTSVLATSTSSALPSLSSSATASVVVFVSSVVISHVLILMVLPSLVLPHLVLLHLVVILLLRSLNIDQLKNVID